jgi:1-deoxy-D-xylulose-5-phosphate synthase
MLLNTIKSPHDLKKLNIEQLISLAEEIRSEVISTVSANGGHLASNLGVVELAIALHYLYDCPNDQIVWDVAHQSYTPRLQYRPPWGWPRRAICWVCGSM